jgi:hypothetical protein
MASNLKIDQQANAVPEQESPSSVAKYWFATAGHQSAKTGTRTQRSPDANLEPTLQTANP